MPPMTIFQARFPGDVEAVRGLFRAYADSLPFSLDYQGFAGELAGMPGPYAPPEGCLLLAGRDGVRLGIVGLKPLAPDIGEVKRLYVVPEARGLGIGRALLGGVLAEATAKGYGRVRLDSDRDSMGAAIALYRRFGFVEIAPYGPNPGGRFAFFEKRLPGPAARLSSGAG
jgi:ribosomal protein S18 acetylase RimI-like enzyme